MPEFRSNKRMYVYCVIMCVHGQLPERGTATFQASDAVTKDAFIMRDFLTSLQASDEVILFKPRGASAAIGLRPACESLSHSTCFLSTTGPRTCCMQVNESAIKQFVATFSARKRHVFDGESSPRSSFDDFKLRLSILPVVPFVVALIS